VEGEAVRIAFSAAPAVANGIVCLGTWDNNLYGLTASTGERLWSYATGAYVESSPTVANGMVYVGSDDDNVYAFGLPNRGYEAKQEKAPGPPDMQTLQRNLNLRASKPWP
jgi:outer membrane protein assembly factor BamB